jgi:hypothetical protein
MNDDAKSVVLVFAGFVALTLAFKGTWANVWHALLDKPGGKAAANPSTTNGGDFPTTPGAGAGSGRPGSSPAPSPLAGGSR